MAVVSPAGSRTWMVRTLERFWGSIPDPIKVPLRWREMRIWRSGQDPHSLGGGGLSDAQGAALLLRWSGNGHRRRAPGGGCRPRGVRRGLGYGAIGFVVRACDSEYQKSASCLGLISLKTPNNLALAVFISSHVALPGGAFLCFVPGTEWDGVAVVAVGQAPCGQSWSGKGGGGRRIRCVFRGCAQIF